MNETDFEHLRAFVGQGDQQSFAAVVRRHVHLVYGTALRKVADPSVAEEVAQNVFATLARKAWQFAPDDSVPAWLYQTALLEAKEWWRGELRRRRREQTAAELGTTMKTQEEQPALRALVPLLDEALLSLREKDRTALLLRFYESQSLREVGTSLGVGEDAAQKRVAGALEKLTEFFQRRGFKTATTGVAAAALQHTATAAPENVVSSLTQAALHLAPPAQAGLLSLLARLSSLTKLQVAAVCLVVATTPVAWQWQQNSTQEKKLAALQLELESTRHQGEEISAEVQKLRTEESQLNASLLSSQDEVSQKQAAQKLAALRKRTRAFLTADGYRWPEDLPFVRLPKSALPALTMSGGPITPARLQAKIQYLLNSAPPEQAAVEQVFSNYLSNLDQLVESSCIETNGHAQAGVSRLFTLQPLGPRIRGAFEQLSSELAATLGEERWVLVKPDNFEFTNYEQVRILGYYRDGWDKEQQFEINIYTNPASEPMVRLITMGQAFGSPEPLRTFLPGKAYSGVLGGTLEVMPHVASERIKKWLSTQAATRLSKPEKP